MDPMQFTKMMLPHALAVSRQTGLDPRLVIAQSALETGYGKSAPNNNYFGIKSHGAGGARMATTEVVNGQPVRIADSFRTYGDPGQSAADYARFLQRNPRYKGVLAEGTLQGQIDAMGKSGYATDPNYAAKLSRIATGLPIDDGMMIGAETMAALGKGPQVNMLPDGQPSRGLLGGGGDGGVTTSTQGAPMEPPRKPSIWDKIGGPLADPDKRARLAMALEGMTLNPNQGVIEGAKQGIAQRAETKRMNQTAQWLRSQGRDDLAQAVEGGMIGGGDAFAAMQAQAQANQPQNVQYGLTPQPFVRKDGSIGMGVFGDNGTFKEVQLPDGAEIAKGIDKVDAGDRWILMDKFGNKVGEQPKNLEAAAEATARGAKTGDIIGTAIAGAPGEVTAADEALRYIDEIRNHPGIDQGTGLSSVGNIVRGTKGYDFQNRVNQVRSGAFLTAIDQLRGMGALSNAEGKTATDAVTRIETATSKAEFLASLADYERIVKIGRDRSASRMAPTDGGTTAPTQGQNKTKSGVTWSVEP